MRRLNTQMLEEKKQLLDQAEDALHRFLSSPQADDLIAYLKIALDVTPVVRDTPEKTYYQLGKLAVCDLLEDIQKTVRGSLI